MFRNPNPGYNSGGSWWRNRHVRASERQFKREMKAQRKERRRAQLAFLFRHRWKLYPAAFSLGFGFMAWLSSLFNAFGWSIAHLGGVTLTLTNVTAAALLATAGFLGKKILYTRRDRIYLGVATTYFMGLLGSVANWWLPFAVSPLDKFAILAGLSTFGWIPLSVPYWWHFRIRQQRHLQRYADAFPDAVEKSGLTGAKLRLGGVTLLFKDGLEVGEDYRVRLRQGQTIEDFSKRRAKSAFDVPADGTVDINFADKSNAKATSRDVIITVIRRHPWVGKRESIVEHPLINALPELEAHLRAIAAGEKDAELADAAKGWLPGSRTARDPLTVAQPVTGGMFKIKVWEKGHGGVNWLIGGPAGSGKGVLINNIICGLLPCSDARVMLIDNSEKEGADARCFGDAIKLYTTHSETVEALEGVLASVRARARDRSRNRRGKMVVPSPDKPLGVIIIDECSSSFADPDHPEACERIAYLVNEILRLGRSEGWSVIIAGQRPDTTSMGGFTKVFTNIAGRIQLPAMQRIDAKAVLGHNYGNVEVPLRETHPAGMFVCIDDRGVHEAMNRTLTVDSYDDLARIGDLYTGRTPEFEQLTLQGGGHALATNYVPLSQYAKKTTKEGNTTMTATPAPQQRRDSADVVAETRNRVVDVQAGLDALENAPRLPGVSIEQLSAGHESEPMPEEEGDSAIRELFRTLLATAGERGLSRRELVAEIKKHNARCEPGERLPDSGSTAYRVLGQLEDATAIQHNGGVGAGSRWITKPQPVDVGS